MSHSIDLPDEVFAAVQKEAESMGTSPAEAIAAKFVKNGEHSLQTTPRPGQTMRERLADIIGSVASGRSDGSERAGELFTDYVEEEHRRQSR
ncbi:MAG: hypothetical protein ACJ8C4_20265 [Gemmataceae bacterium]